jgi:hypothetical protein
MLGWVAVGSRPWLPDLTRFAIPCANGAAENLQADRDVGDPLPQHSFRP